MRPVFRSPCALRRAVLLASTLLAGCGPSSPEPVSPAPTGQPAASATPTAAPSADPTSAATADPAASAEPAAPPPKPGVPVESAPPPGTNPLSEAESKELASKCKKLTDAITAAAKKAGASKRPIDVVEEVLASPPKLAGVDVPRCSDLMRRDTVSYLAASRESEAKLNLKRIVVGLMTALEKEPPQLCASAPAVPASVDAVKTTPYSSTADDWKAEGWKCARFDLVGGKQVFQYELRTDQKARTFEVIARGWSVAGGPMTELFIEGKVESGAINPAMPILRR